MSDNKKARTDSSALPASSGPATDVSLTFEVHDGRMKFLARFVPRGSTPASSSSSGSLAPLPDCRLLPSLMASACEGRSVRSLVIVDGFISVVEDWSSDLREALLALLMEGEGCETLEFKTARTAKTPYAASLVNPRPSGSASSRALHSAFLISLMTLPSLRSLAAPQLYLPSGSESDLSILAMLPNLAKLRLGSGVNKTGESLAAISGLPELADLEWSGWSNQQLKQFCEHPPPKLSKFTLRNEADLGQPAARSTASGMTRASELTKLPQLTSLCLRHVTQWQGKYFHTVLVALKQCNKLTELDLQLESNELYSDGTHVASLYREFLSLPSVTALSLGGSAVTPIFLNGLFNESSKAPDASTRDGSDSGPGLRMRSLTLHGLNLGRFSWFALLREPTSSGFGRWALRVSSAVSSPSFVGAASPHLGLRQPLLGELTTLRLVDCVNPGHLLPYLSLLPRLTTVRLESSGSPYWDARVFPQSSLQPIRVLDFLTLADCAALTALHCDFPVRPEVDQGDSAQPCGDAEAAEELQRQRRLRVGGDSAQQAKMSGVVSPFADCAVTLHPRVKRLQRDREEALASMTAQATGVGSVAAASSASPLDTDRPKID